LWFDTLSSSPFVQESTNKTKQKLVKELIHRTGEENYRL
jgi:hypothetical protein